MSPEPSLEPSVKDTPPTPSSEDDGWGTPEALMALYNTTIPEHHPAIKVISPARRKKALEYLGQFPERYFWLDAFSAVAGSLLLQGKRPSPGHEHFIANFDWFLQRGRNDGVENCVKAAEGRYQDTAILSAPARKGGLVV